jgi:tRNA (cytidine32/uridine32-2'-O)-methyltransferase
MLIIGCMARKDTVSHPADKATSACEPSAVLENIRVVLVETSHPGNIGAVARAMKNMCLTDLRLVSPRQYPHADATARASGADDILARARVHPDLDGALEGCRLVVGASARLRAVPWPQMEPRECAARLVGESAAGPVALVMGRERTGLTNPELDRCHALVHIPANPAYSSLNLAMSVQVLAYELLLAAREAPAAAGEAAREVAPAEALEGFHRHLAQALAELGFTDPNQSERLLRRLRRLFNRARPDAVEINILRGVLSAAQGRKSMRREARGGDGRPGEGRIP